MKPEDLAKLELVLDMAGDWMETVMIEHLMYVTGTDMNECQQAHTYVKEMVQAFKPLAEALKRIKENE